MDNIPLAPISLALLIFAIQARQGFALHGITSRPVYLPRPFDEAIKYVRGIQDKIASSIEKGVASSRTEKPAQDQGPRP